MLIINSGYHFEEMQDKLVVTDEQRKLQLIVGIGVGVEFEVIVVTIVDPLGDLIGVDLSLEIVALDPVGVDVGVGV